MSYSEDLKLFTAAHTYENMTVDGSKFRYVLSGKKGWQNTGTVKWRNEHIRNVDGLCGFFSGRLSGLTF